MSINGKPVPTCLVGRARLQNGTSNAEFDIYLERLGEHSYLVALESGMSQRVDGPYVVPEGEGLGRRRQSRQFVRLPLLEAERQHHAGRGRASVIHQAPGFTRLDARGALLD